MPRCCSPALNWRFAHGRGSFVHARPSRKLTSRRLVTKGEAVLRACPARASAHPAPAVRTARLARRQLAAALSRGRDQQACSRARRGAVHGQEAATRAARPLHQKASNEVAWKPPSMPANAASAASAQNSYKAAPSRKVVRRSRCVPVRTAALASIVIVARSMPWPVRAVKRTAHASPPSSKRPAVARPRCRAQAQDPPPTQQ